MRSLLFASICFIGGAVTLFSLPQTVGAQQTDIVGDWLLDSDRSDDPREAMNQSRRAARNRPNSAQGGTRGGATRRRASGRNNTGSGTGRATPNEADRLLQQRLMRPVSDLLISKTDSSYVFSTRGQPFAEHVFDGRTVKTSIGAELDVEVKAKSNKNKLEVETKVTGGGKLKETYEFDEKEGVLRVVLEINNSRLKQKIKIKQVYVLKDSAGT